MGVEKALDGLYTVIMLSRYYIVFVLHFPQLLCWAGVRLSLSKKTFFTQLLYCTGVRQALC